MRRFSALIIGFLCAVPLFAAPQTVADDSETPDQSGPKTLYWEDLLPANEDEYIEELLRQQEQQLGSINHSFGGSGAGMQLKTFNVVKELDGQTVRIPGFVVPLEFTMTGELTEFLLVPYQGACIHLPPPPPNQLVFAKADTPEVFGDMWSPIWLTGTLRTKEFFTDLGDAAYTLEISGWEPYQGRE